MNVDVVDGLAAILSGIDDGSIFLRKTLGARDFCSGPVKVAEQFSMLLAGMPDGDDMLPWDKKDVNRRLRFDIREGVAALILVDSLGGDGSVDDLAEYAAHGEESTGVRIGLSADRGRPPVSV